MLPPWPLVGNPAVVDGCVRAGHSISLSRLGAVDEMVRIVHIVLHNNYVAW